MREKILYALGGLAAATPVVLVNTLAVTELAGYQVTLGLYAGLLAVTAALAMRLSPQVELVRDGVKSPATTPGITSASRRIVWRISELFAIDAIAGGFLGTALLSYFFFQRFGAGEAVIAALFFAARAANAVSHVGAAIPIGIPGWPELAFCTASIASARSAFASSCRVAIDDFRPELRREQSTHRRPIIGEMHTPIAEP